MEVVLRNEPGQKAALLIALEEFAQKHDLPASVRRAADLAIEEHLTNIIRYAYEDALPHDILVRFGFEKGCFCIEVEDDGKPFNPLQRPEVDTSVPLDAKPVGGLGIHLIRRFMDSVDYRREGCKNILRMCKLLMA